MKEKFIKNQKGITLIALVITIVVLLILSGVVINSMQQSGIIGKAQKAESEYGDASTNENVTLADYEDKIKQYTGGSSAGVNGKAFVGDNGGNNFVMVVQENADDSVILKLFQIDGQSEKYNSSGSVALTKTNDFQTIYIKFNGEIVELSKNNATKFYDPTGVGRDGRSSGYFIMGNYFFLDPTHKLTAEEASTSFKDSDGESAMTLDPNYDFSILNLE